VTGAFRGWLCSPCNRGIGLFRDSVERLENALNYLRRDTWPWSELADRDNDMPEPLSARDRKLHAMSVRNAKRYGYGLPDTTSLRPAPAHCCCECCIEFPEFGRGPKRQLVGLYRDYYKGKFRGWLCNRCNRGIGLLGDTAEGVEKALTYLQRAHSRQ